jgi:acylphosphatase
MKRAHLWVSGRVQGVFFRQSTENRARELGLTGWVRNLSDGRVEAIAEGDAEALDHWIAFCHVGPPAAHVDHVELRWEPPSGEFSGFSTRR